MILKLTFYKTGEPISVDLDELYYITPGLFESTVVLLNGKRYRVGQTFEEIQAMIVEHNNKT